MRLQALNAVQVGLAAALGIAAALIGQHSLDRDARDVATRRSLVVAASIVSDRLDRGLQLITSGVKIANEGGLLRNGGAQAYLERWNAARPELFGLVLASPTGRVKAATNMRLLGADVSSELWFARGRADASLVEPSNPAGGGASDLAPRLLASFPVRLDDNGPVGVLAVQLGARWFQQAEAAARRSLGEDAARIEFSVIRPGGEPLYSSGTVVAPEDRAGALEAVSAIGGESGGAALGWMVLARTVPDVAGGWRIPPSFLAVTLPTLALIMLVGWWLGALLRRAIGRLGEEVAAEASDPSTVTEIHELSGVLAASFDERRQAMRAAKDMTAARDRIRERLRAFETMSGWAYWSIDLETGQVGWSHRRDAATSESGMPLEEITSRINPEDRDLLDSTMNLAVRAVGLHDVELRLVAGADKPEKRLLVRLARVDSHDGQTRRLHALTMSIEDGRAAEGQAAALAPAFAPAERRQNSMLRPIIDGIIHDFNSVLTIITTNLDTLKSHPAGHEEQMIDRALLAAERGAGLTGRLVTFARRQTPMLQRADVGQAMHGLRPILAASLPQGTEVRVEVPDDLPSILCNERQLEIALINLTLYLTEADPTGSAVVIAAMAGTREVGTATQPNVHIRIAREGFRSVSAPVSREVSGRARLGLEAVRILMAQLGGLLEETVEAGRMTLSLTLPAAERTVQRLVLAPPARTGLRILVVDGDALMRTTLLESLQALGHKTTEAPSGAAALQAIEQAPYDIVITEQVMPLMSGVQLAATLHAQTPDLKIVIMSPRGQLPESARPFLHLEKPFGQAQLSLILEQNMPDIYDLAS